MIAALLLVQLAVMSLPSQLSATQQAAELAAKDRARRAAQEQFAENFRSIQLLGIELLKAHEAGSLLPDQLAKSAKAIQKNARALRSLMALGPPAHEPRPDLQLRTRDEFDRAIRLLAKLVSDFAHNPMHKTPKVFDTERAADAAAKIEAILDVARDIERKARRYTRS